MNRDEVTALASQHGWHDQVLNVWCFRPEGLQALARALEQAPLHVGTFYLHEFGDNGLWIEHESGEGMQVTAETLRKFYSDNF